MFFFSVEPSDNDPSPFHDVRSTEARKHTLAIRLPFNSTELSTYDSLISERKEATTDEQEY